MMVPQPRNGLHLTDSRACPGHRFTTFTRLRISRRWSRQPAQPPPAHFFGSVQEATDLEMPKLPVVKSRQSRVSGQPSQVAGALIPDNTQHSWRDDVGMVSKVWLREEYGHGISS